jgi:hypothetical protein
MTLPSNLGDILTESGARVSMDLIKSEIEAAAENGGSVPDPITASLNVQSPTGDTIANLEDETQSQGLYVASDGSVSINATGGGPGTGALSLLGGGFAQLLYIRGDGFFLVPANLPTADPHVANQLWNSAGTLKVSAG